MEIQPGQPSRRVMKPVSAEREDTTASPVHEHVSAPSAPANPATEMPPEQFRPSARLTTLQALDRMVKLRGGQAVTRTVMQAVPPSQDPVFHHATGQIFQGVLQAARSRRPAPDADRAEARQALAEVMRQDGATPTRDAGARARAQGVWERLKATLGPTPVPFELTVGDDARPRAFSVGGGQVYISARLVKLMPDDALAYVLAHEMHHDLHLDVPATAAADAALERMGQAIERQFPAGVRSWRALDAIALRAALDRQMELEADRAGLELATRAGFDPGKALIIHQPDRLPGLPRLPFGTEHRWLLHPDDAERLREARSMVNRARPASGDAATATSAPTGRPPTGD